MISFYQTPIKNIIQRRLYIAVIVFGIIIITLNHLTPALSAYGLSSTESAVDVAPFLEKDQLLRLAEQQGLIRIVVGLSVETIPEGLLSAPTDIIRQRQIIHTAQDIFLEKLSPLNVSNITRFEYIPYLAMKVDLQALKSLMDFSDVRSIHENIAVPIALADSIPLIGADNAWGLGFSGVGQTVAVLDTGVSSPHPFLSGKVVAEACYSTTDSAQGATTTCPNGQDQQIGSGAGIYCQTWIHGCEHGTHVAGIIAGNGILPEPDVPFSGVAKGANIISIQVFSRFDSDVSCQTAGGAPCVLTFLEDQLLALEYVYSLRNTFSIAAVNMSLGAGQHTGYCDSDPRKAIIDTLRSVNIATVIASGNEGYSNGISAPACISSAISVGATTKSDQVANYSNSASFLDLLAPGSNIYSSIPSQFYDVLSGTSMAAPHVAGAWAVLKSYYPQATVDEILLALQDSGMPIMDQRNGVIKSRIQVDAAIQELLPPPILQSPNNGSTTSLRPTFDWTDSLFQDNYAIQISLVSDFSSGNIYVTTTSSFVPDSDLLNGRTYYWRVWVLRGEASSPFSEVRTFVTISSPPPTPTPPPLDNTPPSASGFTAIADGSTANLSTSGVQDNSGGSGVREVRFSANFNNQWIGIGTDTTSPYSLTWNMCASGVPDGDVELGMEVWDNANNVWIWSQHYGNPHITKSYNCEPPPPSEGVTLFENTGLGGGSCYITQDAPSIGNYCGGSWNDNAESVLVQGPYYFALYLDDWYGGGTPFTGNPTGDLPPEWRNQASSIRIRRNSPAAFTLFDLGDFNGEAWASDRTIFDLGHWNWNDKAESIQVASGYSIIVCEHADFKGICGRATGPAEWSDINALAQGLRNNVSSIRVCSGPCPEAGEPPSLIYPINNQAINVGEPVILSWGGAVEQFYAEVWGGALGSTLQYGWTNNVQWDLGVLPESPNLYYWHVKGWKGYGETDWAAGSFYVTLPDTDSPLGVITGPQSGGYQGGPTVMISADATDIGSGVNRLEFYAWLDDHWEFLGTDSSSPYTHSWDISSVREGGVWVSADVIDNAGNHSGLIWEPDWAFFIIDKSPPSSAVIPLPTIQMYPQFTVRWSGNDNFTQNDLIFYDVQYQLNCTGAWLDWFVMDNWEGATFNGEVGQTYCFRSRAYDLVGNTEAWPDTADAQTTVNSITKVYLPLVLNGASSPNPTSTPTPSPTLTSTPTPIVTPTPLPGSDWIFIGSGEPEARSGHGMALDTSNNQLVIFGGTCDGFACADTWTYGESGWTAIGGIGPSAREDSFMVYDEDRQKMVLFGGHAWAANVLGDTWEFNGVSWASMNLQINPPARANQAMAYDPVRKRVVLFGGWQGGTDYLSDTWEYDGNNWYPISPIHSPSPRRGARMVYVPELNKIVMFGGLSPALDVFDETWVYDGQDWTQLNPGLSPSARYNHQMIYNPVNNMILLFGGYRLDTGSLADTWVFSNSGWELVLPTHSPPPTWLAGLAYYPPLNGIIMFGGNSPNQGNVNNDIWLYTLTP